jgi:uncharacterized protein
VALTDPVAGEAARRPRGWAFIDLAAQGRNAWWRYALTLILVVLAPIVFIAVSFTAIFLAAGRHVAAGNTVASLVLATAFVSVILAGATLAWCVARIHGRPWPSLVSCDLRIDWRRLAIGVGVEGSLLALSLGLAQLLLGQPRFAAPGMSLWALGAILVLVPFQAASEEMLFRGYLTQALGRLARSRIVIAAIVGIVFGAMHFNAYGALTLPYLCGLSLIYSLVSLRDERLELTIGAHTATNWFGVAAANALETGAGGERLTWAAVAMLFANGALFYVTTRFLVARFCAKEAS